MVEFKAAIMQRKDLSMTFGTSIMTVFKTTFLVAITVFAMGSTSTLMPTQVRAAGTCPCFSAKTVIERCKFQEPDALKTSDRFLTLSCRPPAASAVIQRYVSGYWAVNNGKPVDWICESILIPDDGSKWTRESTHISADDEKACRGHIQEAVKTLALKDNRAKPSATVDSNTSAPARSATDTYLAYVKAAASKTTKAEELIAYHAASERATSPSSSPGEQKVAIEMTRGLYGESYGLEILSEKTIAKKSTVKAAICMPGGDRMLVEVKMIPEGGRWKILKGNWSNRMVPSPDNPDVKLPEKCLDCDTLAADPDDPQKAAGWDGIAFDALRPKEAIQACRKAVASQPSVDRFAFQLGRALDRDESFKEAAKWYRQAAEKGYSGAMVGLGILYADGAGVDEDTQEALRWYRKAVEMGNADAMVQLGKMYDEGQGVGENRKEAVGWYRKAAEKGHSGAMYDLGYKYAEGEGVKIDLGEAVRWYQKAAEKGLTEAMVMLGEIYDEGKKGIAKDPGEAVRWYQEAAEKGSSDGMVRLGGMYFEGKGVGRNPEEAVYWYRQGAEKGHDEAMFLLGWMYADGQGVSQDWKMAAKWIFHALSEGNNEAFQEMTTNAKQWDKSFRSELRRLMKEAGVYSGTVDGRDFGPGTISAIKTLLKG